MPGQPGKNTDVRFKVESVFGTPVVGAGGEMFRIQSGAGGLSMGRALIEDPESRSDGQRSMARLGSKEVTGSYPGTLSVGTFNTLLAALFRNTFVADAIALTCTGAGAYVSLATTTGNTLTLVGTGSFLTQGVKVGDVIRVSAMGAGVDDVNAVVATVSALVITVLGTPWTNIAADTNAVLTIKKKLKNGATLTRSSYTFEQYYEDLDESEQFAGVRVISLNLEWQPNGVVRAVFGLMGQSMAILPTASAPGLTAPTEYTSIGLVAVDASIFLAGTAIATITGGSLTFDLGAQGIPVVGSTLTPDIYEGAMKVTGQITAVRLALTASHLARFIAETDNIELSLMLVEPDAAPPIDFIHVFIPRIKYLGATASGLGDDGPIVETIPIYAAAKATTTGYDAATATISTSA